MAGSSASDDAAPSDVEPTDAPSGPDDAVLDPRTAALRRDAEAAAAAKGRAMVDEARAVRKRMLDDLEQRRATLLAELERVRAAVDDLARDLAAPLARFEADEAAPPAPARSDTEVATADARAGDAHPEEVFARLRADQAAPPAAAPAREATRPEEPTPLPPRAEEPPPPQLVMNPVLWPSARILKKHWATSSISSAIASALLSTIALAAVLRSTSVLCRADNIASVPFGCTSFSS